MVSDETPQNVEFGEDEDLFDFPDVTGLDDFGLVGDGTIGKATAAPQPGEAELEPPAPLPAPRSAPPSAPAAGAELDGEEDEDLFSFGELFEAQEELESPALVPDDDAFAELDVELSGEDSELALDEPEPSPAVPPPAPPPPPTPAPAARAEAAPAPPPAPAPIAAQREIRPAAPVHERAAREAPTIVVPDDLDVPKDKSKLLWVLIGCFLIVNSGLMLLAHQASANFHSTLSEVTGALAEALTRESRAAPAVEPAPEPVTEDVIEVPEPVPLDPRDYRSTHEIAVGNARALLDQGRYEESRRLLFHVLANQDRIPLPPSLREEIDYLIPLTYFEQGRVTAPETASRRADSTRRSGR